MRAKILSSGLEAKTCYRGERIPAIGNGWSGTFLLHCVCYRSHRRFLLMVSPAVLLRSASTICVGHFLCVTQLTLSSHCECEPAFHKNQIAE
jgi:hypothetical protein